MKYFIITGTSRGLGESLVEKLLSENSTVFCISITKENESILNDRAKQKGSILHYFQCDLSEVGKIDNIISNIFTMINLNDLEGLYLINNASMLAPIKPIGKCSDDEISTNIKLNLMAPMILTTEFIKNANEIDTEKRIINISSGAGKKPYFGWSSYCTAKAGIDMYTKCTAFEETTKKYPVEVLSFAPGVVDTEMQAEIRSTSKEDFIHLDRFIDFKEKGVLLPPSEVANVVIELLLSNDFTQGGIIDIKEILNKTF